MDARHHGQPGGQLVAAELDRLGEPAQDADDHRPQAQRLLDRRGQVGLLAGLDLGAQPRQLVRVADQPLDRPGERRRRRLVAGDQQGEELVVDLGVAHRRAVLVAGGDQQREDVVALLEVVGGAPVGDLADDQLGDAVDAAAERRDEADPVGADRQHRHQHPRVGEQVEEGAQRLAQFAQPRAAVDAEDGLDDDLERHRLHPRAQLVGLAGRPALDLPRRDLRIVSS